MKKILFTSLIVFLVIAINAQTLGQQKINTTSETYYEDTLSFLTSGAGYVNKDCIGTGYGTINVPNGAGKKVKFLNIAVSFSTTTLVNTNFFIFSSAPTTATLTDNAPILLDVNTANSVIILGVNSNVLYGTFAGDCTNIANTMVATLDNNGRLYVVIGSGGTTTINGRFRVKLRYSIIK